MKKPGNILRRPAYSEQIQTIVSKKIGAPQAPLTSNLDMEDIFDGRSSCPLDYSPTVSDSECEIPTRIVYVVKKGATSTGIGWIREYYNKAKCVDLCETSCTGAEEFGADKIQTKQRPPRQTHPFGHKSNQGLRNTHMQIEHKYPLLDFVDADFDGDEYLDWDEEEEADEETECSEL